MEDLSNGRPKARLGMLFVKVNHIFSILPKEKRENFQINTKWNCENLVTAENFVNLNSNNIIPFSFKVKATK